MVRDFGVCESVPIRENKADQMIAMWLYELVYPGRAVGEKTE